VPSVGVHPLDALVCGLLFILDNPIGVGDVEDEGLDEARCICCRVCSC
jgi:hypothetical protein